MANANNNAVLLELAPRLFWDIDPTSLDLERHADYIIERMLEYGTWEGITWLRGKYGDERIKQFLKTKAYRLRSKKTITFWQHMLDMKPEECKTTRLAQSSVPPSSS